MTATDSHRPNRLWAHPWWALPGLFLLGIGLWGVVADVPALNILWYIPAWYGYLLLVDALIFWKQRHSFISHRRRELAAMLFWSVPFWFIFEAYNLVIKNWYYVYAFESDWVQGIFAWVAFATVFPACFFHAELLRAFGAWRDYRIQPVDVSRGWIPFFAGFGALCVVLPLIWPRYCFWMVWGAALGLPEVINYYVGAPSLLRDLERGEPGRLFRLLAGGMWAGLIWEFFNFWARCKWIYTVPFMEDWKLFEMPFLGFLGFPVLALEAFALYGLFNHFLRGGRTWEKSDYQPTRRRSRPIYMAIAIVATVLSIWTYTGVLEINLLSRRAQLSELDALDAQAVAALNTAGIHTPGQLQRALQNVGATALARQTGLEPSRLTEAEALVALALHKGMGLPNARLLQHLDIEQVPDLTEVEATALHQQLTSLARIKSQRPPRLAEVKVWVRAAKLWGQTKR